METSNQPARSTWNLTQTAFDEIRLLYAAFSRNPFDGFSLLRDHLPTTESLKAEYAELERQKQTPYEGPSKIVFLDFYRLPDKDLSIPSDRVRVWLYRNRIAAILQKHSADLRDEMSRTAKEERTALLTEYRKTLESLSVQLTDFDGLAADNFPELLTDTATNWTEIYSDLNEFIFLVRRNVRKYQDEIGIWLKQTPATSAPPKDETPKQAALAMFYFYSQDTGELPPFKTGEMKQEYEKAVEPYGLSARSFQQHYNRLTKRDNRMAPGNRQALLDTVQLLQEYPKALAMATDDLNTAKTRNPLT